MSTTNMNHLRVHNVSSFIDSIRTSFNVRSHLFVGRDYTWENETVPPTPDNSVSEYLKTQNDIIGLQEIQQNDCVPMVRRLNWTSGVVFDIYRHDYTSYNISYSGASNIYDANFYVFAPNRHVYVCLDNNGNKQSTVAPQDIGDDPFYTSDGYQWLRLYRVSTGSQEYVMDKFIPVTVADRNILVRGGVYSAHIEVEGKGLNSGTYYYTIEGDGNGGVVELTIGSGVESVKVVRPGIGYTNATVDLNKQPGYRNLADVDNNLNRIYNRGDGTVKVLPIISPLGGWGYDIPVQLGATRVGVNVTGTDLPAGITYRQIGIIQDPMFDSTDEYIKNTGRVIYLSNIAPVTRVSGQNEKITFLISF